VLHEPGGVCHHFPAVALLKEINQLLSPGFLSAKRSKVAEKMALLGVKPPKKSAENDHRCPNLGCAGDHMK
jgi:hypothetical protein